MLLPSRKLTDTDTDLVLGFEHQQVGDISKWQTQADHLSLSDVVRKLADVNDPGWHPWTSYVTFKLLAVIAIGYRRNAGFSERLNYGTESCSL